MFCITSYIERALITARQGRNMGINGWKADPVDPVDPTGSRATCLWKAASGPS